MAGFSATEIAAMGNAIQSQCETNGIIKTKWVVSGWPNVPIQELVQCICLFAEVNEMHHHLNTATAVQSRYDDLMEAKGPSASDPFIHNVEA